MSGIGHSGAGSLESRRAAALERLRPVGQDHVLAFWDTLGADARESLLAQVESLPMDVIDREARAIRAGAASAESVPAGLEPAPVLRRRDIDTGHWSAAGARVIGAGRVACFTVAGGQGTRLGWDGPKGIFPATPLAAKPLFQVFAEGIAAARARFGAMVRWYIMTSPLNHAQTHDFLAAHSWFGLGAGTVTLIPQGTLPSLSRDGRILMASPSAVAVNPDGHGGAVRALRDSGALDQMRREGIDTLSMFQVDNPLVRVVDPLFIGLHAEHPSSSAEASSKVVPKRNAAEKVGVFCASGGRTMVVEYSDLPAGLASSTSPDGSLRFSAGSIAIHAFGVPFLERIAAGARALPLHHAAKKVPHVGIPDGRMVEPASPNAVKLETFIFDAVPLALRALVLETDRAEEFAPIKNAEGEDSPASSRTAQLDRAARWLESRGSRVARDASGALRCEIEISPLTACDASEIPASRIPREVSAGERILL
ncbi:MAG: UDPGP type 1 family protein [Phycisphaerales bacterium]|nr:UDPGP type 1 family protein [Phycisphaerales bacterium]